MKNNFLMWGERGLVTTFLFDLSSLKNPSNFLNFLENIELADGKKINFKPQKIKCIIEPDFGNKGFGHPDALILFENTDQEKILIFFEAKLITYGQSSKNREHENFNSSINGQLELNHRLTIALSRFSSGNRILEEPSWIEKTDYINERYTKLRILKNEKVIERMVKPMVDLKISSLNYYHIILTKDDTNPLLTEKNLPQLFDENNIDRWSDLKTNFGWINFENLKQFAEKYFEDGKFLDTLDLNSDPSRYVVVEDPNNSENPSA